MDTKNEQSVGQTHEKGQSQGVAAVATGSALKTLVSEDTFRSEGTPVNMSDDMVRVTIDMKRMTWFSWKRKMFPPLPNTNVQRRSGDEPASPSVLKPTDQPPAPERSL